VGRTGWVVMDQPLLADGVVRFAGEPVAAVAADTEALAVEAVQAIELDIEPAPAVTELRAAAEPAAVLVHTEWESYATIMPGTRAGNLLWEGTVERGDVDAAFAREDVVVVEDEYEVPRQHQAYVEPRAATARWEGGRCIVHSSTQGAYRARDVTALFCGVKQSQVRIVITTVGGGFGGKVDFHLEPFQCVLGILHPLLDGIAGHTVNADHRDEQRDESDGREDDSALPLGLQRRGHAILERRHVRDHGSRVERPDRLSYARRQAVGSTPVVRTATVSCVQKNGVRDDCASGMYACG